MRREEGAEGAAVSAVPGRVRARVRVGREDAEAFWRESGPQLRRFALYAAHQDEEVAEEALQEAWVALLRYEVPVEADLAAWMTTIIRREVVSVGRRSIPSRLRRAGFREERVEEPVLLTDEVGGSITWARRALPPARSAEEEAWARLTVEAAVGVLASMTEAQRRPWRGYLAGLTYREIAEAEGITVTNVNRHLTEGRVRLREALG